MSASGAEALDSANATARDSSLPTTSRRGFPPHDRVFQLKARSAAANSADFFEDLEKDMEETGAGPHPYQRQDFEHARGLLLNMHLSAEARRCVRKQGRTRRRR